MIKNIHSSYKICAAGAQRFYVAWNKYNYNSFASISKFDTICNRTVFMPGVKFFSADASSIRVDHSNNVNKIQAKYELGAYFISLDNKENEDDGTFKKSEKEAKSAENAQEVIAEIKALRKHHIREKKAKLLNATDAVDNFGEGVKLLLEASAGGSAEAYCLLGNLYLEYLNNTAKITSIDDIANRVSVGCNKYFLDTHQHNRRQIASKCIEYYTNACAADKSACDAFYNLGNIYYSGIVNNSREYYEHMQSLDDTSTHMDTSNLDRMILKPNYTLSMEYFERAGDASALFWMGYCYFSGGTEVEEGASNSMTTAYPIDYNLARKYLEQASQLGHDQADYYLALLSTEIARFSDNVDPMEKYYYLARSILLHGDMNATCHLASLCHDLYFKDVDLQGRPNSFTCCCKHCGIGSDAYCRHIEPHVILAIIDQLLDTDKAVDTMGLNDSLLTVSISVENKDGMSTFSKLTPVLEFNNGVKRLSVNSVPMPTPELVHKLRVGTLSLFEKAISLGSSDAATALGSIYFHGAPPYCEKDQMKAYQYYNIAAEQGDTEAWRNIISMFIHGHGVPKSLETAQQMMSVMFPDEPPLVIPDE